MSIKSPAQGAGRGEDKAKRPSQHDLEQAIAVFKQNRDTPMYKTLIDDFVSMASGEVLENVERVYSGWKAEDYRKVLDALGERYDEVLE